MNMTVEIEEPVTRSSPEVDRPGAAQDRAAPRNPDADASRTSAASNGNGTPSATEKSDPQAPMTEQQRSSIRKLCQHLGKAEPQVTDNMNYLAAKELIAQLSQEYRQSRSKAS